MCPPNLQGLDSVPDTVHHCIVWANPETDTWWHKPPQQVPTDGIHKKDKVQPGTNTPGEERDELKEGGWLLGANLLFSLPQKCCPRPSRC